MFRRTACLLMLVATLLAPAAADACPNCTADMPGSQTPASGDAAASTAAGPGLADGFYYSILLMLAVPLTLAGAGGYALYRLTKPRTINQAAPTAL